MNNSVGTVLKSVKFQDSTVKTIWAVAPVWGVSLIRVYSYDAHEIRDPSGTPKHTFTVEIIEKNKTTRKFTFKSAEENKAMACYEKHAKRMVAEEFGLKA